MFKDSCRVLGSNNVWSDVDVMWSVFVWTEGKLKTSILISTPRSFSVLFLMNQFFVVYIFISVKNYRKIESDIVKV